MSANPYQKILASDRRICNALKVLRSHNRGQNALCDLKRLFQGMAGGLDSQGAKALQTLVSEYFNGGRRDFVHVLPSLPPEPPKFEEL